MNPSTPTALEEKHFNTLPTSPGVYQFFDGKKTLLYIGKAKNLKKRISSYFQKNHSSRKLDILVRKIKFLEYTVVDTETDALLLENTLIKAHQPRYNVMLKDGKSYPWICIKNERFPRIFYTRSRIKDGSEYFGPYTSSKIVSVLMDLIRSIYPIRTCTYLLSEKNISEKKYKVCLEYHIQNCKGPCEGHQKEEEYNGYIKMARELLKGNFKSVTKSLKGEMNAAAAELEFEKAQFLKEKLEVLEHYQARSVVVSSTLNQLDVFAIVSDEKMAFINFLQVSNGSVIRAHTMEVRKKLDESDEDLLVSGIIEIRQLIGSLSKEIVLPFKLGVDLGVKTTVPKLGDKHKILQLSMQNAKRAKLERLQNITLMDRDSKVNEVLIQAQKDLGLSKLPHHIECFDNSNIQGTNPVSACVVFKNGKPCKKEYRHFNIKTVEGPDDFASMREAVFRRYQRILGEGKPLPDVLLIDGGKGQVSAALDSLKQLGIDKDVKLIGIAKKLETLFFPNDPTPLFLDKRSTTLRLIQQLRDEAHRFGLSHHRNRRSKQTLNSELDEIPGIGTQSKAALFKTFGSVSKIKEATFVELQKVLGRHKAQVLIKYFKDKLE